MGLKLFDDDGGDGSDDLSKIEINEEFARRYEHNKKREDLQRFEELKKKGIIDSGSDSEEEDESSEEEEGEVMKYSSKKDLKFFDALIKVRNQDPSLKNKDAKLFDSEDEDEEEEHESNGKEKKKKPLYLKDVTAQHLIEKGAEFEDEDEDEGEEKNEKKKKSYFEEQEQLRKEFLDAAGDEDDVGEFLKVKDGQRGDEDGGDDEELEFQKKLDEYFKEDEKLDENERYLKDYFRKKMWLDKDAGGGKVFDDGLDVSEDEEALERQEDYEREFNFRHEENADDRVITFSRKVDGSVREDKNKRKLQRKSKEERMALAESQRREELKHLKNLKKKEINEKLRKIRETAGIGDNEDCLLDEDDLEEEFDPDEYDRKMKKAFDEKYYDTNDVDPEFGSGEEDGSGLEKPDFDEEDELLGLPKEWDDQYGSGDGFSAARERAFQSRIDNAAGDEQHVETALEAGKRKKKRKRSRLEEEVLSKELEEYYKMDYEDTIGDLRTRFRYRPVSKSNYGLAAPYILLADDKELNQIVPLKKMAPYVDDAFKVSRKKIEEHKQRIKSLLKGETSDGPKKLSSKHAGKISTQRLGAPESENGQPEEQNLSRKQRRKMRQKEFKLPPSRMLAYLKIKSKSKSKKKQKA